MSVLGSVKNRIKTRFIINRNIKKKKDLEEEKTKQQVTEEKQKKQSIIIPIEAESLVVKPLKIEKEPFFTESKNSYMGQVNIKPAVGIPKANKMTDFEQATLPQTNKPIVNEKTGALNDERVNEDYHNEEAKIAAPIYINDKDSIEVDKIKEYVKVFINNTKKEIKELKKELKEIEQSLKQAKDEDTFEKEKDKIAKIHDKIMHLKEVVSLLLTKYNFDSYDEVKDEMLLRYIDDFEFKSSTNDIDTLVEECKSEIIKIEGISELTNKLLEVENKKDKKQDKINALNLDYDNRTNDFYSLEKTKETIKRYIEKESEYLKELSKELNNNELGSRIESHLVFDKSYIDNLLRLGIGLTAFQTTYIGAFIGAFMIRGTASSLLRGAFKREEKTIYFYRYQEYVEKIDSNISLVENTIYLLNDSINDLEKFKNYMEHKYNGYLEVDKYKKLYKKIDSMLKELIVKKEKAEKSKKELLEKKEKSKVRQKKLEEYNG